MKAEKDNRVRDIYVGLDIWGRGCPGGGGFNSAHVSFSSSHINIYLHTICCIFDGLAYENLQALQRIRNQDLSVAIFAPAWTFEYFGPKTFPRIENIFWAQLMEFLYIHVPVYENERFITTFCRGAGMKYYEYGSVRMKSVLNNP